MSFFFFGLIGSRSMATTMVAMTSCLNLNPRPLSSITPPRNLRRRLSGVLALRSRRKKGHRGPQARQKPLAGAGAGRRRRWQQQRQRKKGKSSAKGLVAAPFLFVFVAVVGRPHAPLRHDRLFPRPGRQARGLRERGRRRAKGRGRRRRARGGSSSRSLRVPSPTSVAPALLQDRALPVPRGRQGRLLRPAQVRARAAGAARVRGGRETPRGQRRPQRPPVAARPRGGARESQQGEGGAGAEDGAHGAVVPRRRRELGRR